MKWSNQPYEPYLGKARGIKGRKDNVSFKINDHTKGFSREHLGWWISVHCLKTDKRFNSLWSGLWWKDIEEAKQWCEDFSWDKVGFKE